MRTSPLLVSVFLLFASCLFAQTNTKELDLLRSQANISRNEIIRVNSKIGLPPKRSLKVFLAMDQNPGEKKRFGRWIVKWNKSNGPKHGLIEVVDKSNEADAIVAQFRSKRGKFVKESTVKVGNISKSGGILDKARVDSDTSYKKLNLPIYSYLLVRSNGFWTIIFDDVESILDEEQFSNPAARLRGVFKKRLKNR